MNITREQLKLYAVTDRSWLGSETLYEQVEKALKGGVTLVQLRAAEESPVPDISVEVQPVEEYEDGYTIRVNGYESPFSIILSTERINDEYPIYSDTTTLSESFFVEYPVVYIKLFAKFKDGESDRYNPATVIVSADGQVLLLMEGAFYSLERR